MSVNDFDRQTDTLADRLKTFREALGHNATEMAAEVALLVGTRTTYRRIGEWERGQVTPEPATIAAIALIHPISPRACLEWLRDGGKMPRIHVDRDFGRDKDPQERGAEQKTAEVDMDKINRLVRELIASANDLKDGDGRRKVLRLLIDLQDFLEETREEVGTSGVPSFP